jgi:elongation factor Ts
MTTITASHVKELRERTGAGMMDCKKALQDAQGDMEAAIEILRKSGAAKAVKKAGRIATEGRLVLAIGANAQALVEVNCETDFVAKDAGFARFAQFVAEQVLAHDPADVAALAALPGDGVETIEAQRQVLITQIGENISVRRLLRWSAGAGKLCSYLHGTRIGVLVELAGGDDTLGRDIAMHVAAAKPEYLDANAVPAEVLTKEREIYRAEAATSGKADAILDKMVEGRIKKYLAEVTLPGQAFIKNPDITVATLLQQANAQVLRFVRLEVGEGLAKKSSDFAAEVMAQLQGQ